MFRFGKGSNLRLAMAAFLVGAGNLSYFSHANWAKGCWEMLGTRWWPEYDRRLGAPRARPARGCRGSGVSTRAQLLVGYDRKTCVVEIRRSWTIASSSIYCACWCRLLAPILKVDSLIICRLQRGHGDVLVCSLDVFIKSRRLAWTVCGTQIKNTRLAGPNNGT